MEIIEKIKNIKKEENIYKFMTSLHKYLVLKIKQIKKEININIPSEINMIIPDYSQDFTIYLSTTVSEIVGNIDPRMKKICHTEKKMIDLNNLLIYSFDKEFIPEKKYNIKFDIKLK